MKAQASFHDGHPGVVSLRDEVIRGLSADPRQIPPKFFYDARGSALFDQICDQPEYYQTRTEMAILERALSDLVHHIGDECLLVELGSGASKKVRLLLEGLRPAGYVGVDISKEFSVGVNGTLGRRLPLVGGACRVRRLQQGFADSGPAPRNADGRVLSGVQHRQFRSR